MDENTYSIEHSQIRTQLHQRHPPSVEHFINKVSNIKKKLSGKIKRQRTQQNDDVLHLSISEFHRYESCFCDKNDMGI